MIRRGFLVVLALIGAVFLGFLGPRVAAFAHYRQYLALHRQIAAQIRAIRPTDPAGDPLVWDCARGMAQTAFANVCYDPSHASYREMQRFQQDLTSRLLGPVDASTMVWIWDRLGETGPHGRSYSTRLRPLIEECFPQPPPIAR